MDATAIRKVLIVGAGTSGQQIALQFARFGFEVAVYDVQDAAVRSCRERSERLLQTLARDGVPGCEDPASILSRIHPF
ncbi:MAG: 3-hydroxyacyl-CoA dehydrogenase NAD-binding domain-containing protein, partial [Planctomycetes bacterium]|nr:3-hydroxyacyl-CoA dehydrogenase NAD-binding domain-containing protein [Planctomycetota bacterium]